MSRFVACVWSRILLTAVTVGMLAVSSPTPAQVPALLPVPKVSAVLYVELWRERHRLETHRKGLQARSEVFSSKCLNVKVETPAYTNCVSEHQDLEGLRDDYIDRTIVFNSRVAELSPETGKAINRQGEVTRSSGLSWDAPLSPGEVITTGTDGRLSLQFNVDFAPEAIVQVGPNSSFRVGDDHNLQDFEFFRHGFLEIIRGNALVIAECVKNNCPSLIRAKDIVSSVLDTGLEIINVPGEIVGAIVDKENEIASELFDKGLSLLNISLPNPFSSTTVVYRIAVGDDDLITIEVMEGTLDITNDGTIHKLPAGKRMTVSPDRKTLQFSDIGLIE